MNDQQPPKYQQPPGSLLVVIDPQTGATNFNLVGPFNPGAMNNALDLAKATLIGQQIQAMQARREPGVEVAPAGMQVPRNPRAG